ncbi:HNH endonuclease family protein [Actinomadura parmotrematis]|uniref:HNH endonuclease family protein n=1 Tax=Actinomadura parmotrematis TaxID=2864039 RepID=A0ABS7G402_9ACTN|nr:HNH endonuclease family protein [Actinomadura parmotrematis]MBW8487447.1 HNH endonuclease family protein [Actinomadura parmotrematis]
MVRARRSLAAAAVLGVLAPAALAGCNSDDTGIGAGNGQGTAPAAAKPASKQVAAARKDLSGLKIASEGSGSGYSRKQYGVTWKDTDHNGCDQRNDILARDLTDISKKGKCIVMSGKLNDPYSGKQIDFTKSKAMQVQIDHIYPLALTWRMGASGWSADKREKLANDHDELIAVWGTPNQQKSDKGPSEWKPQKSFQCTYGVRFIEIAKKYGLPVTRADHDALQDFLARC